MKLITMIKSLILKFSVIEYLLLFWMFLNPIKMTVLTIIILLLIDYLAGLWSTKKIKGKTKLAETNKTLSKMILYTVVLFISLMIHTYIFTISNSIDLVKIVAFYLSSIELKSFFDNVNIITGTNIWQYLSEKMSSFKKTESDDKLIK